MKCLFRKATENNENAKNKKGSKKKKERKISISEEEDDDDCFCLVCLEPFSNSKAKEKWIQCIECKKWAHELCTPGPNNFYTCQNCESALESD